MLRPPAEVAGSRAKYYNNKLGAAHLVASWVNMLLHTELATRDSPRVFVRYADLLDDWVRTTQHVGSTLDLRHVLDARSEQLRDGHRFIDPSLRRITVTLDELDLPPRLREITEHTWAELDAPGRARRRHRRPDAQTLDQLTTAYVDLYAEAEAISRSTVVAATARAGGGVPGGTVDRAAARSRGAAARGPGAARPARGDPAEPAARRSPGPRPAAMTLHNLEGHADFDITWPWERAGQQGRLRRGATAVLRVKDEAANLPFVLPPLLRCTDAVLLVDNGSTDGTAEVAVEAARVAGAADRLTVRAYPFDVARAGAEHLAVHERSVHSLSYFYNWAFAQVDTAYSWKWDGDMVLTREGELSLRDLGWQVGREPVVVRMPRHGLFLDDDRRGWLDLGVAQPGGVGLPDRARLRLRQGLRVGDPPDAGAGTPRRAARPALRRAQAPARRGVRALDRPGVVRDLLAQPAQAPRVGGLPRAARGAGSSTASWR